MTCIAIKPYRHKSSLTARNHTQAVLLTTSLCKTNYNNLELEIERSKKDR